MDSFDNLWFQWIEARKPEQGFVDYVYEEADRLTETWNAKVAGGVVKHYMRNTFFNWMDREYAAWKTINGAPTYFDGEVPGDIWQGVQDGNVVTSYTWNGSQWVNAQPNVYWKGDTND